MQVKEVIASSRNRVHHYYDHIIIISLINFMYGNVHNDVIALKIYIMQNELCND